MSDRRQQREALKAADRAAMPHPLKSPLKVRPGEIDDHELMYQLWRCIYAIRSILIVWVLVTAIAAVTWFVVFSQAKDAALR